MPRPSERSEAGEYPRVARNLSRAVCYRTVSCEDAAREDHAQFEGFNAFLEEAYPLVHRNLEREVVGRSSLLFTWRGSDPEARPLLLAAHIDVVPVEPGTVDDWTHPPYDGVIAGGCVWGRGTLDCKGTLIPIMEAVETLLERGWQPRRAVMLAFGEDEECGGRRGAAKIAEMLESRGVSPELVVDEGGAVVDLGGRLLKRPIAAVGQAEKGYLTVDLVACGAGGHSSAPPRHTSIGVLARAITRLERHPFPARLAEVPGRSIDRILLEMPAPLRAVLGNRCFTGLLMKAGARAFGPLGAMMRTTTAVTMIEGGTKDNVLPQEARATVNLRLLTGETVESAIARVEKVVGDRQVSVVISGLAEDPPPVASLETEGYGILELTITECLPDALVVPYLVVGMTDSRFYSRLCDAVFRFSPLRGGKEELDLPHGTDERIKLSNLAECVEFYSALIRNGSADSR